jgi:hypothetical protein
MKQQAFLSNPTLGKIRRQIPPPRSEIYPETLLTSLFSGQKLQIEKTFNRRLRILIPTTVDVNMAADTSPFVERANRLFSQLCGGTMCQPRFGFYESDNCGLVKEMVFEVEAWTNDLGLKKAESAIEDFIVNILVQLGQETVFFAVDNQAYLLKLPIGS